jgi:FkbM family methyltransferase
MELIKQLLYSILDVLSFGKGIKRNISGFSIYFPARWSRYFESDYEQENIAFLKAQVKPGDVVFDIGAHLGLMSVIASQLSGPSGKVYAFEPSPSTFDLLKKVLRLNSTPNSVIPEQMAITNTVGKLRFFLSSDPGSNSNSLVEKHHLDRAAVEINCTSLDTYSKTNHIRSIAFIKIDAEGSELQVLQGAEAVLQVQRPKLILAVHPRLIRNNGNEPREIFSYINALNYTILYKQKELDEAGFCSIEDFFDVHLLPKTT